MAVNSTCRDQAICRFLADQRGNMLLWLAAVLPLLMAASGAATDYVTYIKLRTDLQVAADAAALAAAREVPLAKSNPTQLINVARSFAEHHLGSSETHARVDDSQDPAPGDTTTAGAKTAGGGTFTESLANMVSWSGDEAQADAGDGTTTPADDTSGGLELTANREIDVNFDKDKSQVKVGISAEWTPMFASFLNLGPRQIEVRASARYFGAANVCVLGLSTSSISGVRLWNSARMTGENCVVYSNNPESDSLAVMDTAVLSAEHICVVGGASIGSAKSVNPLPITDCPPLEDPLASRQPPSFGGCDHNGYKIASGSATLSPGVYCGGLSVSGTAKVKLDPGIYVIRNGPLSVTSSATLTGKGVGFYLTGSLSTIWFTAQTTIDLGAPAVGELAGLLFFEDRAASGIRLHRIASNNARNLLGTIYLPVSILNIDSAAPVADQSAYTAIVTKSLQLQSGPDLILNTDYDLTDVPVPEGIIGSSRVVLSE